MNIIEKAAQARAQKKRRDKEDSTRDVASLSQHHRSHLDGGIDQPTLTTATIDPYDGMQAPPAGETSAQISAYPDDVTTVQPLDSTVVSTMNQGEVSPAILMGEAGKNSNDRQHANVEAVVSGANPTAQKSNGLGGARSSRAVVLDLDMMRRKGYLTHRGDPEYLLSTYRVLKRPLLLNAERRGASAFVVDNPNIIMVTSALPSEGKTYNAINLASSIAMEKDKRVLLIDADVAKPSLMRELNIELPQGLNDLLLGDVDDMSDIMRTTNIPKLSILSAGRYYSHATELLASEAMAKFVREISRRYADRIIVFDSPPLLLTTESSVLASHMGQVVVVVEAEQTNQNDLKKGLALLANEIKLLVLNKQGGQEHHQYGYYGHTPCSVPPSMR